MSSMHRMITGLLLVSVLFASGCTIVKPVVNSVAYAPTQVVERLDRAGDDDEPDDLPGPMVLAAFVVLFPLNYAYWTTHGTVASLFSGFTSDLNWITGSGTIDRGIDNLLKPMKTNRTGRE